MNILIALVIGIAIGITFTYLVLQPSQRRKIIKLERLLREYQRVIEDNPSNRIEYSQQGVPLTILKSPSEMAVSVSGHLLNPQEMGAMDGKATVTKGDNTDLQNFLNSKGIQIKKIPPEKEADEVLGLISLFMGTRYSLIRKFYERIKSNLDSGRGFTLNLKDYPQESVSSICQLATNLYKIAYLEEYHYQKSPKFILYARPNKIPQVQNFFSGQWLERFVKEQVIQLLKNTNSRLQYSYLLNPQIILPNGNNFELDVMFKIEEDIFWFEAKTGDYQRHIDKYSRMSSLMGLDQENSYMILTDIPEISAEFLSSSFKMTVVSVDQFTECFQKSLQKYSAKTAE